MILGEVKMCSSSDLALLANVSMQPMLRVGVQAAGRMLLG